MPRGERRAPRAGCSSRRSAQRFSFPNKSSPVCERIRVWFVSRKRLIHLLFHLRIGATRKWLAGLQQEQETPSSAHCGAGKRLGGHLRPRSSQLSDRALVLSVFGIQTENYSAQEMLNHGSQQTSGSGYKDVYPAAVIRTVSGREKLSGGKVNRFPALSAQKRGRRKS